MKITIKDRNINIKTGFRALMIYERIADKSFQPRSLNDIILFFYSSIIASDKELVFSFDEYLDYIDENPTILNDFLEHLTKQYGMDKFINQHEEVKGDNDEKKE